MKRSRLVVLVLFFLFALFNQIAWGMPSHKELRQKMKQGIMATPSFITNPNIFKGKRDKPRWAAPVIKSWNLPNGYGIFPNIIKLIA